MEDNKIIDLYFQRDEQAISMTADKYGKYCLSITRGILRADSDAEECVNDTYLRARNLAVDRLRTATAQKRGGNEAELALEELGQCISPDGDPANALELQALQQAIARFLHTLPRRERDLFVCRYFYVEKHADLAKRFHIRETNARNILSRTRKKLHDFLLQEGFDV